MSDQKLLLQALAALDVEPLGLRHPWTGEQARKRAAAKAALRAALIHLAVTAPVNPQHGVCPTHLVALDDLGECIPCHFGWPKEGAPVPAEEQPLARAAGDVVEFRTTMLKARR
jgi:hypothetical protein